MKNEPSPTDYIFLITALQDVFGWPCNIARKAVLINYGLCKKLFDRHFSIQMDAIRALHAFEAYFESED